MNKPRLPFGRHRNPDASALEAGTPQQSPRDIRAQQARVALADLRTSPKLRTIAAFSGMFFLGTIVVLILVGLRPVNVAKTEAAMQAQIAALSQQVDQFASSCASKGTCKTFPFAEAEQRAMLYASACFNYSSTAPRDEQAARLESAGGPKDCGMRSGAGSATIFPDSSLQLTVNDDQGTPRADLGVVGVKVWMVGEPGPMTYSMLVKTTGQGLRVISAGGIYTSPPTTSITSCLADATENGADEKSRIQSMEAGRTGQPNIDPNDYLVPGLSIAKYGPGIKDVTVKSVAVCRGSTPSEERVVATVSVNGPVRGSEFTFDYGYELTNIDGKWFISGWGPVDTSNESQFILR